MTLAQQAAETRRMVRKIVLAFGILCCFACAAATVGSMSGLVMQGEQSSSVNINFNTISFPVESLNAGLLNIQLTNLSGDGVNFILSPKNPDDGANLTTQFPVGTYLIDGNLNQFQGEIAFSGSEVISLVGASGGINLVDFATGTNQATGQTAVMFISGEFSVTLASGGTLNGSFSENFAE